MEALAKVQRGEDDMWRGIPWTRHLRKADDRARLQVWKEAVLQALLDQGLAAATPRQVEQLPVLMRGTSPYLSMDRVLAQLREEGKCEEAEGGTHWMLGVMMSPVRLAAKLVVGESSEVPKLHKDQALFFPAVADAIGERLVQEHGAGAVIEAALVPQQAAAYLVKRGKLAPLQDLGFKVGTPDAEEVDVARLKVHCTREKLRAREDELARRMDELKLDALSEVKAGRKDRAKELLRRRMMLQQSLSQLMQMTTNVESVALALEQAELNSLAHGSLKTGSAALKQIREASGLSEEKVLQVIEDYEEELDKQRDIGDALASGGDTFDMQELEAELAELVREPAELELPSVPNTKLPVNSPARVLAPGN